MMSEAVEGMWIRTGRVTDGSGVKGLTNLIIDGEKGEGMGGGGRALWFNW